MSNPSKAREKAKQLVENFMPFCKDEYQKESSVAIGHSVRLKNAKACAIIHCDEVLMLLTKIDETKLSTVFYTEVKQEIQSL